MPAERYYLPHPLQCHDSVEMGDLEFHHLTHVMRAKAGEEVELVNGMGVLAHGRIASMEKKKAIITITASAQALKPAMGLILAQAIPRVNRLDFIVEKGTELGMTELWLFAGERSERKELSAHQLERYKAVAVAAMKQSGRLYLPQIILKKQLREWEKPACALFFGDLSPNALNFKALWKEEVPPEAAFFIGPESGLTDAEVAILHGWQAQGVHLHANILRTDTAALAALTLASHW